MLIEKDYCDYDTCVALNELGFENLVDLYFNKEKNIVSFSAEYKYIYIYIPRISLYEAQGWLREVKDIYIEVYSCTIGYIYELCKAYKPGSFSGGTIIYTPDDFNNPKLNNAGEYDDFETCLLEGIKAVIKILKEDKTTLG